MAIAKMSLVSIDGDMKHIDAAILQCVNSGIFHPEQSSTQDHAMTAYAQENPYTGLLKKIVDCGMQAGIYMDNVKESERLQLNHIDNLEEKIEYIRGLSSELAAMVSKNEGCKAKPSGILSSPLLKFRIGRLSKKSVKLLKKRPPEDDFIYRLFYRGSDSYWCAYVTSISKVKAADAVFGALAFERVLVPHDILSTFDSIRRYEQQNDNNEIDTDRLNEFLDHFNTEINRLRSRQNELIKENAVNEQVLAQLSHIQSLNVPFKSIFSSKYIAVRFGYLPRENLDKLSYYDDQLFLFHSFDIDEKYCWCVYFTPHRIRLKIDSIFASLLFSRIHVPDYIHGTPEESETRIAEAIAAGKEQLSEINTELDVLISRNKLYLSWIHAKIHFLSESFNLRRYAGVLEDGFHLVGFVPEKDSKAFKKRFSELPDISVTLRPSDSEPRLRPPTKLENNRFNTAFEMFTEMYGMPSYGDLDPTPFVAITYFLVFGMMFGDVGQGALLILLGFILWKLKGMQLGKIIERIGVSSILFGFVYGECFGTETLLEPFYHRIGLTPIKVLDSSISIFILGISIAVGVVLLVVSISINIGIGIRNHDWPRAFLSQNGVAGLLFYLVVLLGSVGTFALNLQVFSAPVVLLGIVLPVIVIFLKEPLAKRMRGEKLKKPEGGFASFFTESFFEVFEIVLSFATNTISFVRIGALALSHASMMAVVRMLSETAGAAASPIVMIIGNLFVMALEGLIVGIQVLRLEYYELFSRFMRSDGKEFSPLRIGFSKNK